MEETIEALRQKANALAGRDVEVTSLVNGNYIVEWFSFSHEPPPSAATQEEALKKFISYMQKIKE